MRERVTRHLSVQVVLEAALALTFGTLLFPEPITVRKIGALVLIVGGIALLRTQ